MEEKPKLKRGRRPNVVRPARFTMTLPGGLAERIAQAGKPFQATLLALAMKEFGN